MFKYVKKIVPYKNKEIPGLIYVELIDYLYNLTTKYLWILFTTSQTFYGTQSIGIK